MANVSLEYVASGISHVRFASVPPDYDMTYIKQCVSMLNNHRDDHNFSILFNAFTERSLGDKLGRLTDQLHSIHADSGGLQMMTRGMQISPADKQKIYDVQADYADVGMCFDEIPIVSSGKVSVSNLSARYFDHSLIKEKATLTGQNIKEQIHRFHDLGTGCKPMLILQGNCFNSFQQWVDYCCEAIGDDLKYVYGISSAGSALGSGERENAVRAFFLSHGQYPSELNSKIIHLLGVGSPSRFLPYAALSESLEGCHISYDSTTHTSGMSGGQIFTRDQAIRVPKTAGSQTQKLVDTINEFSAKVGLKQITVQQLLQTFRGSLEYQEASGNESGHFPEYIDPIVTIFAYTVSECMVGVHSVFQRAEIYEHFANKLGGLGAYNALSTCRDINDFTSFMSQYGKYMKTNKILSSDELTPSLEEFC